MKDLKWIAVSVVVILVVAGLLQNLEPVTFRFWPLEPLPVPKTVLILISAIAGSITTLAIQWYWRRPRRSGPGATL